MRSRVWERTVVVALGCAVAVAAWSGSAGAAKAPDPCKMLKASEISEALGGATVADPVPGLTAAALVDCSWDVAADASSAGGGVFLSLQLANAKAAYKVLRETDGIEKVPDVKKTLYMPSTGALMSLDGKTLVTVQAVILDGGLTSEDDERDRLIPLLELVRKQV